MNPERSRKKMVDEQLVARGIKDQRVLAAMESVPRHCFVAEQVRDRAYEDCALPIEQRQTISQPFMVAVMTEALELKGKEKVLEIGTGSGYQTAVLARLSRHVCSIERLEFLAVSAREILAALLVYNVTIRVGDGTEGWPEEAPFDAIIVTAGSPEIPFLLVEQLAVDGRMVIPIGDRKNQVLHKIIKQASGISDTPMTGCVFVPLIGSYGWNDFGEDNGGSE